MHVTKLRVAGFKSFVEPTELHIERGLTGIVGPNGCGKSNLVEALRWVMGETAPRQVRGGGMEDVIFGGTSRRPAHAIAEATLSLDNSDRTAPPGFEDAAEIEVTRRIERGEGSAYTVNGDEVRARDVHILFADAATGAHSSALVGQGRIGDIIGAKPAQRRALLEEAAGITGLHARRHEAELKLRAAETNLERLQDVIGTLEAQLRDLERQARHAKRYRRLSERIRETEAALLLVRWMAARARVEEVTRQAEDAARRVAQATEACRRCRAPAGGHCRGAARAAPTRNRTGRRVARLRIEHERLAEEEQQLARDREQIAGRLAQIAADIEREEALAADAEDTRRRLDEARAGLAREAEGDAAAEAAARAAQEEARAEVEAVEQRLAALAQARARAEAEREALDTRINEARSRRTRLEHDFAQAKEERASLEQGAPAGSRLAESDEAERTQVARFEEARAALREAEAARTEAESRERALRETLREADAALAGNEAERAALGALLADPIASNGSAMWDRVTVKPGFETAVGAALGDDLQASTSEDAPVHWRTLSQGSDSAPLPPGAVPLTNAVRAPEALAARLAQIGVVAEADGARLQSSLCAGQRLVSRDGSMWRWDGYTVAAEAPTARPAGWRRAIGWLHWPKRAPRQKTRSAEPRDTYRRQRQPGWRRRPPGLAPVPTPTTRQRRCARRGRLVRLRLRRWRRCDRAFPRSARRRHGSSRRSPRLGKQNASPALRSMPCRRRVPGVRTRSPLCEPTLRGFGRATMRALNATIGWLRRRPGAVPESPSWRKRARAGRYAPRTRGGA